MSLRPTKPIADNPAGGFPCHFCPICFSSSFKCGVLILAISPLAHTTAILDATFDVGAAYPSFSRTLGGIWLTLILAMPPECTRKIYCLALVVTVTLLYVCVPI